MCKTFRLGDEYEVKKERIVYFPQYIDIDNFEINNFITSLLLYDKIKYSIHAFIYYVLCHIPKKYHEFLLELDFIELWEIYLDDPLEKLYDEMKCGFISRLGYKEAEFERLAQKIRLKAHRYTRENIDVKLLSNLMIKNNGDFIGTGEYLDLYDAIQLLKANYYSTKDKNLLTSALVLSNINIDMGKNDIIFEINRFPDLSDDITRDNFNFVDFISLREKEGANLLREVIFKEENYNNPEELVREYNDIILREGIYNNKKRERAFWGLSNGLSILGVFSGQIILTLAITSASILSSNHRLLYKSSNDKLESFIKSDLRGFIESLPKS